MASVRDPVCGMMINPEKAVAKGIYGDETIYFCSEACHRTYEARSQAKAGTPH
ncbi:MAG: YHS domain-containing protein [Thermoplasmata archaeon]